MLDPDGGEDELEQPTQSPKKTAPIKYFMCMPPFKKQKALSFAF